MKNRWFKVALTIIFQHLTWTFGQPPQPVPPGSPPQSVFIDPKSFAVLGPNGPFRNSSFTQFFNPTSGKPPFIQIFDEAFLDILGPNPSIHEVASNPDFAFAHEAPVYVPDTDEVFFASNDGGALGNSDINHNNKVGKISMQAVEKALQGLKPGSGAAVNVSVTELDLPDTIQMTNGGTGPLGSSIVLITSGRGPLPPSIALVNPKAPHNVTVLLDNFFGRQFNSLNDIKIHPVTGDLFFTDPTYGFLNHFRPEPLMRNQVYRLDMAKRSVRVVATDFDKCNGIAFTPDGNTAYVTDTGANSGFLGNNQTAPATIYAFDVDPKSQAFFNRRIFAYTDTGIPDGVQVDAAGNVYAGCGDGVQVWSPEGTLLGKFFIETTSANMIFAGDGRLVIMAETKIFVAKIAAKEGKVSFP
ncbi:Lactonohydrolase oryL [Psilocybe cubensis]|uniref:SMP-30/Gluconolactonase/LRE-like region domain-containing protein n=2 Tax=Psilocybe cubensis TaxID=181762 RepID=A0A8H7XWV4_PSICU|nr:Lactonohydrolase oryL [Psilocybe cubensis]KAH9475861.1 Lactonohydrolase oryL [Psilocybe cubensis]